MSDELNRGAGRWAVAIAATAAFMVGGGFLGFAGSAQAGGEHGNNVGSPGRDGQSVTCYAYGFSRDGASIWLLCTATPGRPGAPGKAVDY